MFFYDVIKWKFLGSNFNTSKDQIFSLKRKKNYICENLVSKFNLLSFLSCKKISVGASYYLLENLLHELFLALVFASRLFLGLLHFFVLAIR